MKLLKLEPVPEWFGYLADAVTLYRGMSILIDIKYPKYGWGVIYEGVDDRLFMNVYNQNHKSRFRRFLEFISPFH